MIRRWVPSPFVPCRSRPKCTCQMDLNVFLLSSVLSLSPQDVSAALHHRHHHHHPRPTYRLHCLGETTAVAPCPRVLLTDCPNICLSYSLQDTHTPFVIFMLFLTTVFCHSHVTPFAARDAFIIPATLTLSGMDIFVVRRPRRWTINCFDRLCQSSLASLFLERNLAVGRESSGYFFWLDRVQFLYFRQKGYFLSKDRFVMLRKGIAVRFVPSGRFFRSL
jgi:hypothetical protein